MESKNSIIGNLERQILKLQNNLQAQKRRAAIYEEKSNEVSRLKVKIESDTSEYIGNLSKIQNKLDAAEKKSKHLEGQISVISNDSLEKEKISNEKIDNLNKKLLNLDNQYIKSKNDSNMEISRLKMQIEEINVFKCIIQQFLIV